MQNIPDKGEFKNILKQVGLFQREDESDVEFNCRIKKAMESEPQEKVNSSGKKPKNDALLIFS